MPHQISATCHRRGGAEVASRRASGIRHSILKAAGDGYTILCNEFELFSPRVAELIGECATLLGARCSANLYATPARAQGFPFHSDPHDVYVVQLVGRKTWRTGKDASQASTFELSPGNVLFVPQGVRHCASTGERASIHLTISVSRLSLADMLETAVDKILDSRPELRGLPMGAMNVADGTLLDRLRRELADPAIRRMAEEHFQERLAAELDSGPGVGLSSIFEVGLD